MLEQTPNPANPGLASQRLHTQSPASIHRKMLSWEDLRREARKLEGELDVKMAAYAKLCAGFEATYRLRAGTDSAALGADQLAQSRAAELEDLLQRLSDVNDDMGAVLGSASDSRVHILARHRDILQELTQEFRRLNVSLGAARDRAQLLAGAMDSGHVGITVQGSSSGALLRERATVQASTSAVESILSQTQGITDSLLKQRGLFENVTDKLVQVGSRFPAINGLLNAIRRKKSKDTLVLSAVIAACVLFTILYVMARR